MSARITCGEKKKEKTPYYTIHRVISETLLDSLINTKLEIQKTKIKQIKNKMVRSVSFKDKNSDEVVLSFKQDNWKETAKTLYMKHHLIPGDTTSELVSCKSYILSGTESRELYVCWR